VIINLHCAVQQDPVSGEVDPEAEREAKERYQQELAVNQRV
jgi:hypothetical protein